MTARTVRAEVVRTKAGYHGRIRAANGNPTWNTKTYSESRPAKHAIALLGLPVPTKIVDER